MTNYYITTNQFNLNTSNGDNSFVAPGVVLNDGIDMRGSNSGGDQTVTIYGTLFGSVDDYYTDTSGNDQIFIGSTGSVNTYWFGAIMLGGGGHTIVNAGTISSMSYGNAIDIYGSVGAHQADRIVITNTGMISSESLHPERGFSDSTVYVVSVAGVTLTNTGSILSSTGYAINLTAGDDGVWNSGLIQGGVQLNDGNDLFDSRQGTVTGPVYGGSGNDTIYGGKGDDTLVGGDGNDYLDGSAGADTMIGGTGNDTYVVDNADDFVDENNATWGGGGADTIRASINFDLGDPAQVRGVIETLTLTGSANLVATGTARAETINGNVGNNVLYGEAGNDRLSGGAGSDTLYGGDGADTLIGGTGADLMYGGAGNDVYVFDNYGDVANEAVAGSGGTDLIQSSISLSLADGAHVIGPVENLFLLGGGNLNGTGNALNNVITGNSGANHLDGGLGNDTLIGGAGADTFTFDTALNALTNRDMIKDLVHGVDKIALSHTVFTAFAAPGALPAGNFAINAPADGNDFIIYNTTTGGLSYDPDGSGVKAAVPFATLTGVPGITQADFVII